MTVVSVGTTSKVIHEFLERNGMENLSELQPQQISGRVKIFVNGSWVGIHKDPDFLINLLKEKRRNCSINKEVSIIYNYQGKEIK